MKIIINDRKKFYKHNKNLYRDICKGIYLDNIELNKTYNVFAIVDLNNKRYFITIIFDRVEYIETDRVSIVDYKLPSNWIYKEYKKSYVIKKSYDIFGYDQIKINQFIGPMEFIENKTFLIDVLVDSSDAMIFLNNIKNKTIY